MTDSERLERIEERLERIEQLIGSAIKLGTDIYNQYKNHPLVKTFVGKIKNA